jgi:dolichol-phosphate mannosyltransferase
VIGRFAKFGLVGSTGVAINMGVFWFLTSVWGVHYLVAAPCAIELALCSNYLLNHNWTFADRSAGRADKKQFAQYHAVSLGGMLINMIVLQILAGLLGVLPTVANLCGIAAGTVCNFAINANWTWRKAPAALVSTR